VNIGSAPSLRKRLGLAHTSSTRENKVDKSYSMWRTLSKRDKDGIKTRAGQSKFSDHDDRTLELPKPTAPLSRDYTAILGAGEAAANYSGTSPASSGPAAYTQITVAEAEPLPSILASAIQLQPPKHSTLCPRRKRRSSLSDLTSNDEYNQLGTFRVNLHLRSKSELAAELHEPIRTPSPGSTLPSEECKSSGKSVKSPSAIPRRKLSPRKSFGVATVVPVNRRLKMQSPQKVFPITHDGNFY